jgi:hypothetical protein
MNGMNDLNHHHLLLLVVQHGHLFHKALDVRAICRFIVFFEFAFRLMLEFCLAFCSLGRKMVFQIVVRLHLSGLQMFQDFRV